MQELPAAQAVLAFAITATVCKTAGFLLALRWPGALKE
jgi:hypothetical protein